MAPTSSVLTMKRCLRCAKKSSVRRNNLLSRPLALWLCSLRLPNMYFSCIFDSIKSVFSIRNSPLYREVFSSIICYTTKLRGPKVKLLYYGGTEYNYSAYLHTSIKIIESDGRYKVKQDKTTRLDVTRSGICREQRIFYR